MGLEIECKQPFPFSVDCEIIAVIEMTARSDDMYTQEQLEAMSNEDLNKLIANKEGVKWHLSPYSKSNDTPHWIYCDNWDSIDGDSVYLPDYCNSWADMGPIAMDNNIVITPCMGINKGDATRYFEHVNPVCSEFSDNKEALRAAAIVYLMVR